MADIRPIDQQALMAQALMGKAPMGVPQQLLPKLPPALRMAGMPPPQPAYPQGGIFGGMGYQPLEFAQK